MPDRGGRMRAWLTIRFRAAIAAAASLTGKRFGLLVASSVVATSAIVAAAATNRPESSQAAATLLGRTLAAKTAPVAVAPAPAPEPEPEPVRRSGPDRIGHPRIDAAAGRNLHPGARTRTGLRPRRTGARTGAGTGARRRSAEEEETAPPPPKPEAGRIKHVFLDLAGQLRLRGRLRHDRVDDALPERDASSQGPAADQLLGAERSDDAERDRHDQRPAAEQRDRRRTARR